MTGTAAMYQTDYRMRLHPAVRAHRRKPKYGRFSDRSFRYEESRRGIKDNVFIDPCMGSGHILVYYAFDTNADL